MNSPPIIQPKEGLGGFRSLMVVGSLAPLFVLLAVRGAPRVNEKEIIPDSTFISVCLLSALLPTLVVFLRLWLAKRGQDTKRIRVGSATDNRDHLLVYLFALLIPMYQNSYSSVRDVVAAVLLLCLIMFLLFHLNLHYMNIIFAFLGYRVYTIESPSDGNAFSGRAPLIVLSKLHRIRSGAELQCYRISDSVFIEY